MGSMNQATSLRGLLRARPDATSLRSVAYYKRELTPLRCAPWLTTSESGGSAGASPSRDVIVSQGLESIPLSLYPLPPGERALGL